MGHVLPSFYLIRGLPDNVKLEQIRLCPIRWYIWLVLLLFFHLNLPVPPLPTPPTTPFILALHL